MGYFKRETIEKKIYIYILSFQTVICDLRHSISGKLDHWGRWEGNEMCEAESLEDIKLHRRG